MRREFKVNGIRCEIVNRYTGDMEINDFNQKYDVRYYSRKYSGWMRLCSCMTIAEGKEKAVQLLSFAV
jgi:hypothetical protein